MGSKKVKGTANCDIDYEWVYFCPNPYPCLCFYHEYGHYHRYYVSSYNYIFVFDACNYQKKTYFSPTRYYDTVKLIITLNDGTSHKYP
jgi:hypothetical protein